MVEHDLGKSCKAIPSYHRDMQVKQFKTIAIFGGSFDPPTISHITVACEIYNQLENIDEVWILPCGDHRTDKTLKTAICHRLKMLMKIKEDIVYPGLPIEIKDTEMTHGKFMPTIELLDKLKNENPDYKFLFCLGSDLIKSFKSWEEWERIIEDYGLILITRPSYSIENVELEFNKKFPTVKVELDGSSTAVRFRIEQILIEKNKVHLGISGLTTRSVIEYIYHEQLYKVCIDTPCCCCEH